MVRGDAEASYLPEKRNLPFASTLHVGKLNSQINRCAIGKLCGLLIFVPAGQGAGK